MVKVTHKWHTTFIDPVKKVRSEKSLLRGHSFFEQS